MDGTVISEMRTAAASAVATKVRDLKKKCSSVLQDLISRVVTIWTGKKRKPFFLSIFKAGFLPASFPAMKLKYVVKLT